VFSGQANVYLVRERRHFWNSIPSCWLMFSTAVDVMVVSLLATQGILMPAISFTLVAGLFLSIVFYLIGIDYVKVVAFKVFNL